MEQQVIHVEKREDSGKGPARKLRAKGRVPGILYGHKRAPTPFSMDPAEFHKRLRASGLGRNTIFNVKGLDEDVTVMVREAQLHPVNHRILHLDLIEVKKGDKAVVRIPVRTTGRSVGVVMGGQLQMIQRTLKVETDPTNIPTEIVVDVTALESGQALHTGDIALPSGCTLAEDARLTLCTVKAPRLTAAEKAQQTQAEGAEDAEGKGKKK